MSDAEATAEPTMDSRESVAGRPEAAPTGLPATGVTAVDSVLEALAGLDQLPVQAHVERFEAVQSGLARALDAAPPAAPGRPADGAPAPGDPAAGTGASGPTTFSGSAPGGS